VLESSRTGRNFLQEHGPRFPRTPGQANYFVALRNPRRCAVVRDVNLALVTAAPRYVVFDFWKNSFIAPFSDKLSMKVEGGSCAILAIRPESPNPPNLSASRAT
jgi:hypothetical protein